MLVPPAKTHTRKEQTEHIKQTSDAVLVLRAWKEYPTGREETFRAGWDGQPALSPNCLRHQVVNMYIYICFACGMACGTPNQHKRGENAASLLGSTPAGVRFLSDVQGEVFGLGWA